MRHHKTAICILLLSFAVLVSCVEPVKANPYYVYRTIPALEKIVTSVHSPANESVCASNLTLAFEVAVTNNSGVSAFLTSVCYYPSWQDGNVTVYKYGANKTSNPDEVEPRVSQYSVVLPIDEVPEGNQTIKIRARGQGGYINGYISNHFVMVSFFTVYFTVDSTPPKITFLKIANVSTVGTPVSLNYTLNEPVAKAAYSLDGAENRSVTGNLTFSGLSSGLHNVTVYAWDAAGNVGKSKTELFELAEPNVPQTFFPTEPLVVVVVAAVGVAVCLGVFLIFKRKSQKALRC